MGATPSQLQILSLEGRDVPVRVKRNGRARRMTLRVDPEGEGVQLVLPRRTPLAEGLDFASEHGAWIARRLAALPPRIPFAAGAVIPILGQDHEIRSQPEGRRGVWRETGLLLVSGDPRFLERRVGDYLKRSARSEIVARVREKTAAIEQTPGRVTLRDPKTRWGSCSAKGDLSFSWRLLLTPEPVLDYVVAHEVAHLVEHNHSRRFWRLAGQLSGDMTWARGWLRRNGNRLQRYGPASADWDLGNASEGTQT